MAVVLGYGGLGNTNGARDFSSKVEATVADDDKLIRVGHEFAGADDIVGNTWTRTIVRVYEMVWTTLRWAFA